MESPSTERAAAITTCCSMAAPMSTYTMARPTPCRIPTPCRVQFHQHVQRGVWAHGGLAHQQSPKAAATVVSRHGLRIPRNDAMDARSFFAVKGLITADPEANQFGASIGGSVKHDKTFLFFRGSHYGKRTQLPVPALSCPRRSSARRLFASSRKPTDPTTGLAPGSNPNGSIFPSRGQTYQPDRSPAQRGQHTHLQCARVR